MKLFSFTTIAFMSLFTVLFTPIVFAQSTTIPTERAGVIAQRQDDRIINLKSRADTEIDRRISALNKINSRLATIKHLTDSQKSAFSSQITTEINALTTLKTKIDADTDLAMLKTDVQSIVTSYRVFALFIPQIQIVAAGDRLLNVADIMTSFAVKLSTRIQEAQTAGKNVTSLQSALTDMQNKITDAKTQANNAINSVTGLTPAGYPGNKSTLQTARTMLQTARQDLVAARQDAQTIIQGLRALNAPTTTTPLPTH